MALVADLQRISITSASSIWDDETVYGGANPARAAVALYLTAYKVDENQVETALQVNTFDPEVVTQFTTTNGVDGWHKYRFVIINNYDAGVQYERYDLVWDTTQNAFYEYINVTPSTGVSVTNPAYWTAVADPTTKIANVGTAQESGNLIYQVIDKIVSYQTSVCFVKAASLHAKESCGGDCGCDGDCNDKLTRLFTKIRSLFTNMGLDESRGLYVEGEKNARLAQKYCEDCGCLER